MCAPEGPPAVGLPAGLGSSRPVTEADVQKVGGVQVARLADSCQAGGRRLLVHPLRRFT